MTITLDAPVGTNTQPRPDEPAHHKAAGRIALFGDLTCPWSYLASRRASLLEATGVEVEWGMVEHDRPIPGLPPDQAARVQAAHRDLDRVMRRLLPGEELPHALGGFVPYTRPAVSGYAEAYLAGVGPQVRGLLFEAFWMHGLDLGDARLVRSLLTDTVRSGSSPSDLVRDWGYAVDVTGAPVTTAAWLLVRGWSTDWSSGQPIVPVLVLDDGRRLDGLEAVEWLGAEVVRRGIPLDAKAIPRQIGGPRASDLVDRYWASEHGNRWMQARRDAMAGELFAHFRRWM